MTPLIKIYGAATDLRPWSGEGRGVGSAVVIRTGGSFGGDSGILRVCRRERERESYSCVVSYVVVGLEELENIVGN